MNYNQSDLQLTDSTESNVSNESIALEPISVHNNNDKIQFLDNLSVETILTHVNTNIIADIQSLLVNCDGSFVKCFSSSKITSSGAKSKYYHHHDVSYDLLSFCSHI